MQGSAITASPIHSRRPARVAGTASVMGRAVPASTCQRAPPADGRPTRSEIDIFGRGVMAGRPTSTGVGRAGERPKGGAVARTGIDWLLLLFVAEPPPVPSCATSKGSWMPSWRAPGQCRHADLTTIVRSITLWRDPATGWRGALASEASTGLVVVVGAFAITARARCGRRGHGRSCRRRRDTVSSRASVPRLKLRGEHDRNGLQARRCVANTTKCRGVAREPVEGQHLQTDRVWHA
jgi:hypothetical protein